MKISLLLFFVFTISTLASAQFDDKFYKPKKEWDTIPDSINCEEISFTIRDSQKVSALLLEPQGDFKQNILFFHGAGGNVSTYLFMMVPLAERGYRVMMIDVRGYGKSDGTPTHVGIAEDAPLILDWVRNLEDFKDQQIIIYGASMGTQIAANLTIQSKDDVKLLILDGALSSFTDIAMASSPALQKLMIKQFVTSPYSAKEDIKSVAVPVIIIHSKEDEGIPFEQGKAVFDNANEPKFFWEYEGKHLEAAMLFPDKLDALISKALENCPIEGQ